MTKDKIRLDQNIKNQKDGLEIDQLHKKSVTSEGNSTKQINIVDNLNEDNNRLNVGNLIVPTTECNTTELQKTINEKNENIAKLENKINNLESNKTPSQENKIKNQEENKTSYHKKYDSYRFFSETKRINY